MIQLGLPSTNHRDPGCESESEKGGAPLGACLRIGGRE